MNFITDNSSVQSSQTLITGSGLYDSITYNSTLISSSNNLNATLITSNINTSNYASNISNVLLTNINTNYFNLTNITSNLIFNTLNMSNVYSDARHYPSKLWNTIDALTNITYNGYTAYNVNFYLNTDTITFGSGLYSLTFSNKFVIGGVDYPG
jgi:hypothetical protein